MEYYTITGMSCAACSARVEKAVSKLSGVKSCSVNLLTNSMGVEGSASEKEIIDAVTAAGYGAIPKSKKKNQTASAQEDALKDRETPVLKKRFLISLVFLLPLMYISMGHMMWNWPLPKFFEGNHLAIALVQLLLTIIIMVLNRKFFISGFKGILHRSPNMDTLVALGSASAFVYSTVILFAMTDAQKLGDSGRMMQLMDELYFESSATILTLITLGKLLEAHSKGKTTDAIKSLLRLTPKTATKLVDGREIMVPVEEIQKKDQFVVRPGENIPVDGLILEGETAIDESNLTGESIPRDKTAGEQVSAGTINLHGFLRCEAVRVGEDTTLAQIIQTVSDAAATKAPIAKAADKISGVFVPVVICLAVLTTIVWLFLNQPVGFALARGISVLVISCPCALGLATPVAIMVGNGVGAKNGILFKTAESLEKTGKTQILALDKTGTITKGEPEVTDLLPAEDTSEAELLTLAISLESRSEHPLALAIQRRAEKEKCLPRNIIQFKALPGNGLTAVTEENHVLYGGNQKFITEKAEIPKYLQKRAEDLANEGKTPLFFSENGILRGVIAVADTAKEDSAKAIAELKNLGIRVVMLTGDNANTAGAIGKKVGVDEVISDVLPDGKAKVVQNLKKEGLVAMVGDGVNDAPALTSADIGIAIGAGTDIAIDSAEIVLLKNRLSDIPAAIRLSRAALRNIHENLFWAFIYNLCGIPLAMGVFIQAFGWQLNPMFAAAAMSLSSFFVVTNALRLNFVRIYQNKRDRKIRQKSKKKEKKIMKKKMKIKGMMCGHCEATVKKALEAIDGVMEAEVSHVDGTAVVSMEKNVADSVLKEAVEAKEYQVLSIE